MVRTTTDKRGFTLIEILVAMALSAVVAAAIYKHFTAQQQVYRIQDQAVEMQQNLRGGTDLLLKELRMTGFDPNLSSSAGFVTATASSLRFTMDLNKDGDLSDADEDVSYFLYTSSGITSLGRLVPGGTNQPVAENIQGLEFCYTLNDGTQTSAPGATDLDRIRRVEITMLARAAQQDKGHIDRKTYNEQPCGTTWGPFNDGYRRRLTRTTVTCRNMEFK